MAFRDELKHLPFALGERVEPIDDPFVGQVPNVVVEHHLGDRGAEERLAGRDRRDATNQIGVGGVLQQVPVAPAFSAWMM